MAASARAMASSASVAATGESRRFASEGLFGVERDQRDDDALVALDQLRVESLLAHHCVQYPSLEDVCP